MATRIKCSFCDYVMHVPDAAMQEAAQRGRLEWMCLGCGSPIIVEPPLSAAESTLGAPPEMSSTHNSVAPHGAASRVKSVLSPLSHRDAGSASAGTGTRSSPPPVATEPPLIAAPRKATASGQSSGSLDASKPVKVAEPAKMAEPPKVSGFATKAMEPGRASGPSKAPEIPKTAEPIKPAAPGVKATEADQPSSPATPGGVKLARITPKPVEAARASSPHKVPPPPVKSTVSSKPADAEADRATLPEVPKSKDTQRALGAPPPPAPSLPEHSSPRRTLMPPPPPPPPAARRNSSHPPAPLQAFGMARSRPNALPPMPSPPPGVQQSPPAVLHVPATPLPSEELLRQASGVQPMHAEEPARASAATPPPIETHSTPALAPLPSGERVSSAEQMMVPTQRSVQAPRWVYGALAAIALASGAAGYLLRKPEMAQAALGQPREPTKAAAPVAVAPPKRGPASKEEATQGLVPATYAAPATKEVAAPLAAIGNTATGSTEPPKAAEPKTKPSEEAPARELDKPAEAPVQSEATPAAAPPSDEKKDATAPADTAAAHAAAPGAAAASEKVVLEEEPEAASPPAEPFDKEAARIALEVAGARAQTCRKGDAPSGMARMLVTFAPSGRVTSATVSGEPYAGTETGGCLANAFRGAIVPAYAGSPVTVSKTVVIR